MLGLILFLTTSSQALFVVTVLFYLQQLHRVCLPSPDLCDLSTEQIKTNLALVTGVLTTMCKMDHTPPSNHRGQGATNSISPVCLLSWFVCFCLPCHHSCTSFLASSVCTAPGKHAPEQTNYMKVKRWCLRADQYP